MSIYCWGSTIHGELGLGGIEDEQIWIPREMSWSEQSKLKEAACGPMHTLLLTNEGKVFSCGNNDHGQLGHSNARKRPQPVQSLDNYNIVQLACGISHSIAINEWGQAYAWGSNTVGQLGIENINYHQTLPKIIKEISTKHIVQIACGDFHSLCLTNNGELYSWGSNKYGQLGLGYESDVVAKPTLISSLAGIPFAFITCGSNHSFAVTKSGAVFGWGKNTFGQLGLNDETSKLFPCQLKTLRNRGVRYIACGEDFSVFLTIDGGVFSCGSGAFGQLGHGSVGNEILPRMIGELMGSTVTQISCGSRHTLALVPSRGRIYGFGLGGSGQLGKRGSQNATLPQIVSGPWNSPNCNLNLNTESTTNEENLVIVKKIYSGGDHCLASVVELSKGIQPDDFRKYPCNTQILLITEEIIQKLVDIEESNTVDLDLLSIIETIFKSQCCINGSFLKPNDEHMGCTSKHDGVNIEEAERVFDLIRKIEHKTIKELIWNCVTNDLLNSLVQSPADVETLRIYLILPLYHEFINSKNYLNLHSPLAKTILKLNPIPLKIVSQWWALQSNEYFEKLVEIFKGVAYYIINFKFIKEKLPDNKLLFKYEPNLVLALDMMLLLYRINNGQRKKKIKYEVFHISELNEWTDLQYDYLRWSFDKNMNSFYLCNYAFLFDAAAKTLILQTDQGIQMHRAMQNAEAQAFLSFMTGIPVPVSQYIVLTVSRQNLVDDTLRELSMYDTKELKKPLKVKFVNEEAEDAGGVRKEFLMLLIREILDPKYGMFRHFEDSRACWFSEDSFEDAVMYNLIGKICGLAIYNFTIINLPFPVALYKKILNEGPCDIKDLRDLSPILANSMQSILDYNDSDFEETFNLYFEISREVYGEIKKILLKPNGDNIPVTLENKTEFVDLYIDFIFNKSVESKYNAFHQGFLDVCGGKVLKLFEAHELMQVVIGGEDYDWHSLETNAEYKNGYTSSDETIQIFWEVFHELSDSDKKKFLLFLTGSDRIPIQGMKAIKICIQPMSDEKFLPVAHTCFNLLDLPRYKNKGKLKYKLLQAIQQTQGFSLV